MKNNIGGITGESGGRRRRFVASRGTGHAVFFPHQIVDPPELRCVSSFSLVHPTCPIAGAPLSLLGRAACKMASHPVPCYLHFALACRSVKFSPEVARNRSSSLASAPTFPILRSLLSFVSYVSKHFCLFIVLFFFIFLFLFFSSVSFRACTAVRPCLCHSKLSYGLVAEWQSGAARANPERVQASRHRRRVARPPDRCPVADTWRSSAVDRPVTAAGPCTPV